MRGAGQPSTQASPVHVSMHSGIPQVSAVQIEQHESPVIQSLSTSEHSSPSAPPSPTAPPSSVLISGMPESEPGPSHSHTPYVLLALHVWLPPLPFWHRHAVMVPGVHVGDRLSWQELANKAARKTRERSVEVVMVHSCTHEAPQPTNQHRGETARARRGASTCPMFGILLFERRDTSRASKGANMKALILSFAFGACLLGCGTDPAPACPGQRTSNGTCCIDSCACGASCISCTATCEVGAALVSDDAGSGAQ